MYTFAIDQSRGLETIADNMFTLPLLLLYNNSSRYNIKIYIVFYKIARFFVRLVNIGFSGNANMLPARSRRTRYKKQLEMMKDTCIHNYISAEQNITKGAMKAALVYKNDYLCK